MRIRDAITSAHAKTAQRDRFACGVSLRSSVWLRMRIQFLFPMDSAAVGFKDHSVQVSTCNFVVIEVFVLRDIILGNVSFKLFRFHSLHEDTRRL